jgi:hypothetical protein
MRGGCTLGGLLGRRPEQPLCGGRTLRFHVENPAAVELALAASEDGDAQRPEAAASRDAKRDVFDDEVVALELAIGVEPFHVSGEGRARFRHELRRELGVAIAANEAPPVTETLGASVEEILVRALIDFLEQAAHRRGRSLRHAVRRERFHVPIQNGRTQGYALLAARAELTPT